MKSELRFSWPDTGELSVRINGNESAALRFFPSEEAIIDGLRKNGVEAAYGDFADAHFLRLLIRLCAGIQRKCKALRAGIVRSARPVQVLNVLYPLFAHCLGPRRTHSDRAT